MEQIKQTYWDTFNRIAAQKLPACGVAYELLPENPESTITFAIRLTKRGGNYLLFFSTHHLDFSDGVMICTTTDSKIHYETVVLPSLAARRDHNERYGYNDKEIERIVDDICLL